MRRRSFLGYGLAVGCGAPVFGGRTAVICRRFRSEQRRSSSMTTSRFYATGKPTCSDSSVAPSSFVQRRSYREVSELLIAEKLDAAWICGFPYVRYRDRMRLLAVPTWKGSRSTGRT